MNTQTQHVLNGIKVHTAYNGMPDWTATLDGYDGAPDVIGIYSFVGSGKTEQDAVDDLREKIEDFAHADGLCDDSNCACHCDCELNECEVCFERAIDAAEHAYDAAMDEAMGL